MGGGTGGNFGNTSGKNGDVLDAISNVLAAASLIPGLDTFTDLASIPVDLLRKDWVSAGLDLVGAIPFVGEIADTANIARKADKAIDAAKAAKKATNFTNMPKTVHLGKQGKHLVGHNNYIKGKSVFTATMDEAQALVNKYSGTGRKVGQNREIVDFKKTIGKYVDPSTGKSYDTTIGTIHYSKDGTHIVPEKPKNWRK